MFKSHSPSTVVETAPILTCADVYNASRRIACQYVLHFHLKARTTLTNASELMRWQLDRLKFSARLHVTKMTFPPLTILVLFGRVL